MGKRGRPSIYSQDVADEIAERIIGGESLRVICAEDHMPSTSTLTRWLRDNQEFRAQYVYAREANAQIQASEIVEIADRASPEMAQVAKLQIDARKWVAARLLKDYKDKQETDHRFPDGIPAARVDWGGETEDDGDE